jgi:hypothetical protein
MIKMFSQSGISTSLDSSVCRRTPCDTAYPYLGAAGTRRYHKCSKPCDTTRSRIETERPTAGHRPQDRTGHEPGQSRAASWCDSCSQPTPGTYTIGHRHRPQTLRNVAPVMIMLPANAPSPGRAWSNRPSGRPSTVHYGASSPDRAVRYTPGTDGGAYRSRPGSQTSHDSRRSGQSYCRSCSDKSANTRENPPRSSIFTLIYELFRPILRDSSRISSQMSSITWRRQ